MKYKPVDIAKPENAETARWGLPHERGVGTAGRRCGGGTSHVNEKYRLRSQALSDSLSRFFSSVFLPTNSPAVLANGTFSSNLSPQPECAVSGKCRHLHVHSSLRHTHNMDSTTHTAAASKA